MDADDLKVEYQYQTCFDKVPQVLYGLCGFNFELYARDDHQSSSYGFGKGFGYGFSHGYGYAPRKPNALGVRLNAFSSKIGLTIEAFDLSFADSAVVTVDVCFQACTIGPGLGPVHH